MPRPGPCSLPAPYRLRLHGNSERDLLHGWDDELGTFLGAGRPARGDGLGFSVEADRIRPVLIEIAEAGALPAAEVVIGERHRNGEVHAHHADLHAIDEIARGVAVAGEDRNPVAVFMLGRQPHRFLVVLGAYHGEHGPEDFLLVDAHMRLHVVEQTAAHEIAVLVALHLEAAAVDHELGAFLDAEIDILLHLVEVCPGDRKSKRLNSSHGYISYA